MGVLSGRSLGTRVSNLKSVALTILELNHLAPKNLGGHVTMATPPFGRIFGVMSGLSLGIRVSILKSVALTVLELLAFNSHDRPLQTDRQTDKHKRTHYLRHSLRSLNYVYNVWMYLYQILVVAQAGPASGHGKSGKIFGGIIRFGGFHHGCIARGLFTAESDETSFDLSVSVGSD